MEELLKIGISDSTIKEMLDKESFLKDLTNKEIIEKISLLIKSGCTEEQIADIISTNPHYLVRTNIEIIKLIALLSTLGFTKINYLFEGNPRILSLDDYEIINYVHKKQNEGISLSDIVNDLESNTALFDEM